MLLYNLKRIRIKKGLTLKQLSQRTGISTTYLNDLENLKRDNLGYERMERLTKVLNVTAKELKTQNTKGINDEKNIS